MSECRVGAFDILRRFKIKKKYDNPFLTNITAILPLQKLIRETIEYTTTRKAFGRPILDNQTVHYTLAELETEVELLRSLLYRTVGK